MNKESTVKEKRKTHEKLNNAITVICILAIMISILAVVLITKDRFGKKPFSYPDSLGKTVIRVDDDEVTLKEISYYILVAETNVNAAAQEYNSNNMEAYWNMNLHPKYVRSHIRELIIDACTRDNVYYQEALTAGYTLDDAMKQEIRENAVEEMNKLTDSQRQYLQYTEEDMITVLTKIYYARWYVTDLMNQGYTQEELDIDGSYYNKVQKKYKIKVYNSLWEKVQIGNVTINQDYQ